MDLRGLTDFDNAEELGLFLFEHLFQDVPWDPTPEQLASLLVVSGDEGFEALFGHLRRDLVVGEIALGQTNRADIHLGLVDGDNVFGQFRLEDLRIELFIVFEVVDL